jgi:predicted O-methyltransferase YrrM
MTHAMQHTHRLILSRPEVAVPTPECPNSADWRCYDEMSSEVEVLDLLYALVRCLRPRVVLETGTYLGLSTHHLARAVRDNGVGHVHSCDIDIDVLGKAGTLLLEDGLAPYATLWPMRGEQMIDRVGSEIEAPVDFAFIDSHIRTRVSETVRLLPKLSYRGVIAVHDTNTFHSAARNGPRPGLIALTRELGLQIIMLDTPRGLCLLRPSR